MRLKRVTAQFIVLALFTSTTASAQVTLRNTARELTDALGDVVHIWVSPFRAEGRDWISALGVAAGAAALLPVDDQVDSWIVRHSNAAIVHAVSPWDENHPNLGDLSTGQRLLPISVALLVPGMISDNRKLREAGWGCLSAWQASSTIREAVYAGISRERPSIAEGDQYAITTPGGEWEYHSFFGGHAANAWACTSFWNSRFHLGALEPILYAGATGITLSRMKDRRHWASDTWVGIAAGYAMGRSVAARYARREAKRNAKPEAEPIRASFLEGLSVAPIRGGLALGWSGIF
jgi:membrane-associated phospholipid phosphatase